MEIGIRTGTPKTQERRENFKKKKNNHFSHPCGSACV